MDDTRWDRLELLFEQVQILPPEQRPSFIEDVCRTDAHLGRELGSLVAVEADARIAFENLAVALVPPPGDEVARPVAAIDPYGLVGRVVSHYRILEPLGGGGMGYVYKAKDLELKRAAALKFLPPEFHWDAAARQRFTDEAQSASALDHPNLCTIYGIDRTDNGQQFIAMAYYDGETLKQMIQRGPLPVEKAIAYAVQMAQGLSKVHAHGIIHRDIKPANVIITAEDTAKIIDFGIAKLADRTQLTNAGGAVGTPAYMSPEQVRGERVDHRTDIWSLGVVLYEMLTGERPFSGASGQGLLDRMQQTELVPLSEKVAGVPYRLDQVVWRALRSNRDDRYQAMGDLLSDLQSLPAHAAGILDKLSRANSAPLVAVLPFVNLSADKDQEYFCDGLAEEIINALAQVRGLRVVARTSAFAFKGKNVDVRQIGRMLNVDTVVEGSVRRSAGRTRITAQLVNVADGYHLWSARYDRDLADVFEIQDEISQAIVENLKVELIGGDAESLVRPSTGNMEAYTLYLKGRFHLYKFTPADFDKAARYLREAIEQDARFAAPYATLALCEVHRAYQGIGSAPPLELFRKARETVLNALALDPENPEALTALGAVQTSEWDWGAAEQSLRQALKYNPHSSLALYYYVSHLTRMGRLDEALDLAQHALTLDPLGLNLREAYGLALYCAGRYEEALRQCREILELDATCYTALHLQAVIFTAVGRFEESLEIFLGIEQIVGRHPFILMDLGMLYGMWGKRQEARQVLDELIARSERDYVSPGFIGFVLFALGDYDEMFTWMDKAVAERDPWLPMLKADVFYAPVRDDPRYRPLLTKMGLA